jgi:tRNA A58 N-methylase Trm61
MIQLNEDYSDPENKEEYHNLIRDIKDPEMAYSFAKDICNGKGKWIIDEIDGFTDENFALDANWIKVCNMTNQTKKKILIVDKIILDKDLRWMIIQAISEILTRCGWCVRGREFKRCIDCQLAFYNLNDEIDICEGCEEIEISDEDE